MAITIKKAAPPKAEEQPTKPQAPVKLRSVAARRQKEYEKVLERHKTINQLPRLVLDEVERRMYEQQTDTSVHAFLVESQADRNLNRTHWLMQLGKYRKAVIATGLANPPARQLTVHNSLALGASEGKFIDPLKELSDLYHIQRGRLEGALLQEVQLGKRMPDVPSELRLTLTVLEQYTNTAQSTGALKKVSKRNMETEADPIEEMEATAVVREEAVQKAIDAAATSFYEAINQPISNLTAIPVEAG